MAGVSTLRVANSGAALLAAAVLAGEATSGRHLSGESLWWIAGLVLLWGFAVGMILTSILRDQDRKRAEAEAAERDAEDAEDDDGNTGHRWLH